jgi:hypothetical protein
MELMYPSGVGREGGVSGVFGDADRFGEGDDEVDDIVQASVIALGCGPRWVQWSLERQLGGETEVTASIIVACTVVSTTRERARDPEKLYSI